MSAKPVWRSDVERDAWMEKHCRVCYRPEQARQRITGQGEGCPLLAKAERGRLPGAWERRRNAAMGDTYRCTEFLDKPPVARRAVSREESLPLFDEPDSAHLVLVPVEGWPDWRAERVKAAGGDHA